MNYNRTIKIKEDKTQEREQAVKVIASIIGLIIFMFFLFSEGIERHELVECEKRVKQSEEYEFFYSTSWQKEQCSMYNINLK